jgi:hypothetical protein
MNLTLTTHPLTPLAEFTAAHDLPPTFGTTLLAEADPANHSSIWHTRAADLAHLYQYLPSLVPAPVTLANATTIPHTMSVLLHGELLAVGAGTDLTMDEVEFVTDECRNVWEAIAYKLVQLSYTHGHNPAAVRRACDPAAIYQETLDSTVLITEQQAEYTHAGQTWHIQLIQSVYGPLGLAVTTAAGETFYIHDDQLTFPGLPFISRLALTVGRRMVELFE